MLCVLVSAVALFILFIVVYATIADIINITGMAEDKARFQVVSLLTNGGFTTNESEIVANSTFRLKLAKVTMIFRYACTVIIASIVVNIFMLMMNSGKHYLITVTPVIVTCIISAT